MTALCPTCAREIADSHGIVLLEAEHIAEYRGLRTVGLRPPCFAMLRLLHRQLGEIVSSRSLYDELYQLRPGDLPEPKIVHVHMHRLRHDLKPIGLEITTVRGCGYRLEIPEVRP